MTAFSALRVYATIIFSATDFTGTVFLNSLTGLLEVQLGIINACLPLVQPACVTLAGIGTKLAASFHHRHTQRTVLPTVVDGENKSHEVRVGNSDIEHEKAFRKLYGKNYGYYSTTAGSQAVSDETASTQLESDVIMVRGDIDVFYSPK